MRRWLLLLLVILAAPARAQGTVEILDARRAEFDAATNTWVLQGDPVRVRRADLELQARRILYKADRMIVRAEGTVRLARPRERATADRLEVDLRQNTATMEGSVVLEYDTEEGTVVVEAPRVQADLRARRAEATGGVHARYRTLVLRAQTVRADLDEGTVVATGDPEGTAEGVRVRAGAFRADLRRQILYGTGGVRVADDRVLAEAPELLVRWRERVAFLRGGVEVRRGEDRLWAPEVRYDYGEGRLEAAGRARVVVRP
jgi:lipopolysaccharide assembly outer membrane protein LptD (OstA)